MNQFSIHEDNMPKLTEKLNRIQKKCNKYNCNFHFAEIGEEYRKIQHQKEVEGAYGRKEVVNTHITTERFIIVEIEGFAKINNWQFVATIQHTEHGNIIRKFDESIEIPETYKDRNAICEHCNSNRIRKDTYLIINTETNEFKQVGKTCLMDFTSGLSAEYVADYLSYFDTLQKMDGSESLGGFTRKYILTNDYLLYCAETIKKCGFISASKETETGQEKTSKKAYDFMNSLDEQMRQKKEELDFNHNTEEHRQAVKNALEWINNTEPNNDYIHNLKTACMAEYTEYRNCGLLASLLPAYHKTIIPVSQSKSQFIGKIGDKITIIASIKFITSYETQYGYTHIFKLTDSEGNVYIWKTANSPEETEMATIKGTIKEHNEYNGEKQTILTRCKVK